MCVNEALKTGYLPNSFKCAYVRSLYKKADPLYKRNNRPVSILPLLSKAYQRVICKQASNYF